MSKWSDYVATMYYEENLTETEIAEALNTEPENIENILKTYREES